MFGCDPSSFRLSPVVVPIGGAIGSVFESVRSAPFSNRCDRLRFRIGAIGSVFESVRSAPFSNRCDRLRFRIGAIGSVLKSVRLAPFRIGVIGSAVQNRSVSIWRNVQRCGLWSASLQFDAFKLGVNLRRLNSAYMLRRLIRCSR